MYIQGIVSVADSLAGKVRILLTYLTCGVSWRGLNKRRGGGGVGIRGAGH